MRELLAMLGICAACAIQTPACECRALPLCEAVGRADLIFVGTVTELFNPDVLAGKMHIDRVFKGELNEVEEVRNSLCGDVRLEIGRQYLLLGKRYGNEITLDGCSWSRAIEDAEEALAFLDQYRAGKVTTSIYGMVYLHTDPGAADALAPLKEVHIDLASRGKHFEATTDSLGNYIVTGVPAGQYDIAAELSGYRKEWSRGDMSVTPSGCAVADVWMQVDRRVQGVVRDSQGSPVPGALVELIAASPNAEQAEDTSLSAVADSEGRYAINGIPPGEYFLGTNIGTSPGKDNPFPRVFYPGVPDAKDAIKVFVVEAASVRDYDLEIPGKLPAVVIWGRIVKPDGSPATFGGSANVRFKQTGFSGQREAIQYQINPDGEFWLDLCEGVKYSAFAMAVPHEDEMYSEPLEFVASKDHPRITFVVNLRKDEFSKRSGK